MNRTTIWPFGPVPPFSIQPQSRWLQLACLALALVVALPALLISSDWVAVFLSPDGLLSNATILAINAGRAIAATLAIAIAVAAFHPQWIHAAWDAGIAGNRGSLAPVAVAILLAAVLIGGGYSIAGVTGTSIGNLVRDPNAIADQPFYFGALEYAGILLMAMAGGIAVFSGVLLRGAPARFLICGGLLTLLLVCDDLFMLHENSSAFHLNERITFGIYGACALLFAVANFSCLLKSPFILLAIAALFFVLALAVDVFPFLVSALPTGGEDLIELVGICFWSLYFLVQSRRMLAHMDVARP